MNSRDHILTEIKRNRPPEVLLPERGKHAGDSAALQAEGSLVSRFESVSIRISSEVLHVARSDWDSLLVGQFGGERRIASTISGADFGNLRIEPDMDPKSLSPLDVLVCQGDFGVAENGAVWIQDSALMVRAAPFLAEHLVIILDRTQMVATMHEAYSRLQTNLGMFGMFVAGPSKTADIEQSLVVGAQGPRRNTIVLLSD